jgi:hypothetical protein
LTELFAGKKVDTAEEAQKVFLEQDDAKSLCFGALILKTLPWEPTHFLRSAQLGFALAQACIAHFPEYSIPFAEASAPSLAKVAKDSSSAAFASNIVETNCDPGCIEQWLKMTRIAKNDEESDRFAKRLLLTQLEKNALTEREIDALLKRNFPSAVAEQGRRLVVLKEVDVETFEIELTHFKANSSVEPPRFKAKSSTASFSAGQANKWRDSQGCQWWCYSCERFAYIDEEASSSRETCFWKLCFTREGCLASRRTACCSSKERECRKCRSCAANQGWAHRGDAETV